MVCCKCIFMRSSAHMCTRECASGYKDLAAYIYIFPDGESHQRPTHCDFFKLQKAAVQVMAWRATRVTSAVENKM